MTRIEEIEAREKAATPGEWALSCDGLWVWRMDGQDIKEVVGRFERRENAALFFHARQDIPYLQRELKDRDEKLAAVEKALVLACANVGQDVWDKMSIEAKVEIIEALPASSTRREPNDG